MTPPGDTPDPDPAAAVPVSDVVWEILLALAEGERHGYAILQDIEARRGRPPLPGSLYRALHRLEDAGWVAEVAGAAAEDDERRRVLRLTARGRAAAGAEARRRASAVAVARRRGLLAGAGRRA